MTGRELQLDVDDSVRQVQAEPSVGFTVTAAKDMTIADNDDLALAADLAGQLARELKRIEEQRLELTAPLNSVIKIINGAARSAKGPLVEADAALRQEMRRYQEQSVKQQAEERAAAQEATGDTVVDPDSYSVAAQKTTAGQSASVTFRETWTFEVDDAIAAATFLGKQDVQSLRDLVTIDGTALRALVREMGDRANELQIPGIRIWKAATPTVRT